MSFITFEIFGYISSFFFMFCAVPQMLYSIRVGNTKGMSSWFLWSWLLGDITLIIYACICLNFAIPILINAVFSTACLLVIFKYLYWPRKE
jgi:uncharacterized protein with PQ loop repeat